MITTLIIFYSSLILIAVMVTIKQLEQTGQTKILAQFNATAEPALRKFTGETRKTLANHLNLHRLGLLAVATLRTTEKLLFLAQIKIRRLTETLTRKIRYHNLNKPRGTASFFLKDIADYKNHLPRKETLDF